MAKQPKPDSAQEAAHHDQPGRVARLRAALVAKLPNWSRRTRIALAIVVLLIVANGVAFMVLLPRYVTPEPKNRFTLALALAALDRHSLPDARHIATQLEKANNLPAADRGGPLFIFGAVAAAEAESGAAIGAPSRLSRGGKTARRGTRARLPCGSTSARFVPVRKLPSSRRRLCGQPYSVGRSRPRRCQVNPRNQRFTCQRVFRRG